jgi:chemotaxis protein MotB
VLRKPIVHRNTALLAALVLTPSVVVASFLFKAKYDAIAMDAQTARSALRAAISRQKADEAEIGTLREELDAAHGEIQSRDHELSELAAADRRLQAHLDEQTTRARLLEQFVQKFKALIDAGQLQIVTRGGRLVLQLPNDILFDSGQTAIKPAGEDALTRVALVLATIRDRRFQVAGHTDNIPMQTLRFPSNWELSTARALEVVKLLVAKGVDPNALSAAGYGEFDPIASNDTPEGRAKNRRIEITLQPNLDELVTPAVN